MRRVTAKPPKTLMVASRIATVATMVIAERGLPDLQQRADEDDARDRVGHRHQRGVQRVVHVADHVVADHDGQREHHQVPDQRGRGHRGDEEERERRHADERRTAGAADAGGFSCFTAGAAAAGVAAGAADTDTSGGGQVDSPSRTTVIDRCTTSSKSSTSRPSFSGRHAASSG